MKKIALGLGLIALVAIVMRAASAAPQDMDPLKVAADTHKLLFENPWVRVIETKVPPGKTERLHQHGRRVVIYLSDFHTRTTDRGGQPQDNQRTRGMARWSEPVVHQVENIGKTEGHVISVELK